MKYPVNLSKLLRPLLSFFCYLLSILSVFVFTACNDGDGVLDVTASVAKKIASVEEQYKAIETSISCLEGACVSLKRCFAETNDLVTTRANSNDGLKEKVLLLETQIEDLRLYVDSATIDIEWLDATYATLEQSETTIKTLAILQSEVETLKKENQELDSELYKEVCNKINENIKLVENWVNSLFAGYYDIATIDIMLTELTNMAESSDSTIVLEIDNLREELVQSNLEMTVSYQEAIKEAIEKNGGEIDDKISKAITEINNRVDTELAAMNERIDEIDARLTKLEDAVKDLFKRIQSISFLPLYDDESAVVSFPKEGTTNGSYLKMDFLISPKNAVSDIVNLYEKVLSLKVAYSGTTNFIELPITECIANAEQGILSLTATTDSLNMDFYNGKVNARAMLFISDGNNDLTSSYILLSVPPTKPSDNCIYYTTIDNEPIEFSSEIFSSINDYGEIVEPEIISNTYNQKYGKFVLTFSNKISMISTIEDNRLTSINLPESVIDLYDTFHSLINLKTVRLPKIDINIDIFSGCDNLETVMGSLASEDGKCIEYNGCLKLFLPNGISEYAIPDNITAIGERAFENCTGLTSVEIPNSVTTIGKKAFSGCTGLTNVEIPNSVTAIGLWAFENCTSLIRVKMSDKITYIGDIFVGCDNLKEIEGPAISDDALFVVQDSCLVSFLPPLDGINEYTITIPDNITTIGEQVFSGCTRLIGVKIPNSVTTIGEMAFSGCSGLTSVEIPSSVTTIGDAAFSGCYGLTNVEIPNSVTGIGYRVFDGCWGLTSVEIPNGVTFIGYRAFESCYGLTSVKIPNSVATIGGMAFNACSGLASIEIPNGVTYIGEMAFLGCSGLTSVEIPNSVTKIDNWAFGGCSGLTSVEIPNSVTYIGSRAFEDCTGLTNVEISNSVTYIGSSAFENCTGLTSVEIPNSVTYIGSRVFENCTGLTNVEISNSVTTIDGYAFSGCSGLTSVEIPNSVTYIAPRAFENCRGLTNVEIPNSVTEIGSGAFSGCSGLTSVEIPNSVTYIGPRAFENCTSLIRVKMSDKITYIGDIFIGCDNLEEIEGPAIFEGGQCVIQDNCLVSFLPDGISEYAITIPDNITAIGEKAFENCTGLTSIVIPNSVTTIGDAAFNGCSGLTNVEIPNSVTEIGYRVFSGCSGLTSVEIPNSVTAIGNKAFSGCAGLTSIEIPNSVTTIGDGAFLGCEELTSIEIPDGVTKIGHSVFTECFRLEKVYFKSIKTPDMLDMIFESCSEDLIIYVPSVALDDYMNLMPHELRDKIQPY